MMRPHFGAAVFFFYARIGQMNMSACSCGGCREREQGPQEQVLFCAIRR